MIEVRIPCAVLVAMPNHQRCLAAWLQAGGIPAVVRPPDGPDPAEVVLTAGDCEVWTDERRDEVVVRWWKWRQVYG